MKKFLIFSLIGVGIISLLVIVIVYIQVKHEKSFSPEDQAVYKEGDLTLKVLYNRPYKKEREIFGKLVAYNEVWRTGANEATMFETNQNIEVDGKPLKAGKYSLWTIPRKDTWTVIFNSEYGQWGIDSEGKANRRPDLDVLSVDVSAVEQEKIFEQFTVSFEKTADEVEMVFAWDDTIVVVPIKP